eukprot:1213487-Pleurochrysis_carterae.AAC.2
MSASLSVANQRARSLSEQRPRSCAAHASRKAKTSSASSAPPHRTCERHARVHVASTTRNSSALAHSLPSLHVTPPSWALARWPLWARGIAFSMLIHPSAAASAGACIGWELQSSSSSTQPRTHSRTLTLDAMLRVAPCAHAAALLAVAPSTPHDWPIRQLSAKEGSRVSSKTDRRVSSKRISSPASMGSSSSSSSSAHTAPSCRRSSAPASVDWTDGILAASAEMISRSVRHELTSISSSSSSEICRDARMADAA